TFSTFMNEGAGLMKEENYLYMMLYLFGSLALGLIAVLAGHYLAKIIA
ncbi:MAG: CrcB family protein, partial [Segatella copri]